MSVPIREITVRQDDSAPIDVTEGAPRVRSLEVAGLRISEASFPARFEIGSHHHRRACLSVILDGRFQQRFPGATYDCPPGGLLVKPPEERHVDRWGDEPTHHVIVEPLAVDDALGPTRAVFERVRYVLDPRAAFLGRRIAGELGRSDDLVPLAVQALACELMVLAGRVPPSGVQRSDPPAWLGRVRELLQDRFARAPLMKELAAEADVHPSRLSREFRRHYGTTPSSYLRRVRLSRARRDLETTTDPLATVAVRNGFADQSHLTRELMRVTGLTPALYRRRFRS